MITDAGILALIQSVHDAMRRAQAEAASAPWSPPVLDAEEAQATAEGKLPISSRPGPDDEQLVVEEQGDGAVELRGSEGQVSEPPSEDSDAGDAGIAIDAATDQPESSSPYEQPSDRPHPDRPYFRSSSAELEAMLEQYSDDPRALQDVLDELSYRSSLGARALQTEVESKLERFAGTDTDDSKTSQPEELCPICGEHPADTAFRGKPACTSCKNELSDTW